MGVFSRFVEPAPSPDHGSPPASLAPVRGVSLELFAQIASAVAARDDPHAQGTALAGAYGIPAEDWLCACRCWNTRIADDPEAAQRLCALYRSGAVGVAS